MRTSLAHDTLVYYSCGSIKVAAVANTATVDQLPEVSGEITRCAVLESRTCFTSLRAATTHGYIDNIIVAIDTVTSHAVGKQTISGTGQTCDGVVACGTVVSTT